MPVGLESGFVHSQLTYVRREVANLEFPEYLGANGSVVPIVDEIPVGATSYTYYTRTLVGEAKIIANPADDLPTADFYVRQNVGFVRDVGDAFRYSDSDLESAAFARTNLTVTKASAAKQAALVKLDKICYQGDPDYNLLGLTNQPNVPIASILADGFGGSTRWVTKTPTQVLRDLRDISTLIPVETNMVERPDTILIPPLHYFYLTQTFKDGSDLTLLQAFLSTQNQQGIQFVEAIPWLDGRGAGGTGMGVIYKRRRDKVKFHIPIPWYSKRPQEQNFHYRVPCRATTGGVEVTYEQSIRYFQGI